MEKGKGGRGHRETKAHGRAWGSEKNRAGLGGEPTLRVGVR